VNRNWAESRYGGPAWILWCIQHVENTCSTLAADTHHAETHSKQFHTVPAGSEVHMPCLWCQAAGWGTAQCTLPAISFPLPACNVPTDIALTWCCALPLLLAPQVYVKASAWFRVSGQPYPYADVATGLRRLVDVFGPQRVMWGSDFPWVTEQCG
jgi:hypothetical protein